MRSLYTHTGAGLSNTEFIHFNRTEGEYINSDTGGYEKLINTSVFLY